MESEQEVAMPSPRKPRARVRVRLRSTSDPYYDDMYLDPMCCACVSWLKGQGYGLTEIALFLGLRTSVVEALADVDEIDLGIKLGPKAKLAHERGLI
jgi:hypothetical protein